VAGPWDELATCIAIHEQGISVSCHNYSMSQVYLFTITTVYLFKSTEQNSLWYNSRTLVYLNNYRRNSYGTIV